VVDLGKQSTKKRKNFLFDKQLAVKTPKIMIEKNLCRRSTKKTFRVKSLHTSWAKREEIRQAKKLMKMQEAALRADVAAEKE
jgi:endonuclease/exonuclease/phosphatase family metal-dependent hydrolase